MKKFSAAMLSLAFGIFAMEVALRFVTTVSAADEIEKILQSTSILASKNELTNSEELEYDIKRNLTVINAQPKVPHPYFGYSYNRLSNNKVNRDGFFDTIDFQTVDKSDPRYFIIGIFGGSVAKEFAIWKKSNQEKGFDKLSDMLKKEFPNRFVGKKIIFLNFGLSAAKQPQQFIISSFFTNQIHMAITIDGYNDVNANLSGEFAPYFPNYSNLFFSLNPARHKYILEVYELIEKQIKAATIAKQSWIFHRSRIIQKLWTIYNARLEEEIRWAHTFFRGSWDTKAPFYKRGEYSEKETITKAVEVWEQFTIKQNKLLLSENVSHFHFIQPNQHIQDTKPLSSEEKAKYFDHSLASKLNVGYAKLLARLPAIKNKSGTTVYDLTQIFVNTKETVYNDACCHFNEKGNQMLEDGIARYIIEFLKVDPSEQEK